MYKILLPRFSSRKLSTHDMFFHTTDKLHLEPISNIFLYTKDYLN